MTQSFQDTPPDQASFERTRLMTEHAALISQVYAKDTQITQFYADYQTSVLSAATEQEHTKAFIRFEQRVRERIIEEKPRQEVLGLMDNGSYLANQIALLTNNKSLATFATTLHGASLAIRGMNQMTDAVNVMATSGFSLSSMGDCLGAAGLVVGAMVTFASLMGDDDADDTGLGEALHAIHSTMMAMWEDTRNNFKTTWHMLTDIRGDLHKLSQQLNEMERRNVRRFVVQMHAFEHFGNATLQELAQLNVRFDGSMNRIVDQLTSYLDAITDENANLAVDHIKHQDDLEIIANIERHSIELCNWLNRKATIKSHSGRIDLFGHKLDISQHDLLRELTKLFKLQLSNEKTMPFGLLASLVKQLDSNFPDDLLPQMINTRDWEVMHRIYSAIMHKSLPTIAQFSATKQQAYLDNVQAVKQKPIAILELFDYMQHSDALWDTLMDNYLEEYHGVQQQIEQCLEMKRQNLNEEYNIAPSTPLLMLQQNFEENCERLQADSNLYPQLKIEFDLKTMLLSLGLRECDALELLQTQEFDACHARMMTPAMIIARSLNLVTFEQSVIDQYWRTRYSCRHSFITDREEWSYPLHVWTHSLTSIDLKIRQFNTSYPLYTAKLRKRGTDFNVQAYRGAMQSLWEDGAWVINPSSFALQDEYKAEQLDCIKQFIEEKILRPRRKLAAKELKQHLDLTAFNVARLKLLCFYKLFIPEHQASLEAASQSILQHLTQAEQQGDAESFQTLLNEAFGVRLLTRDLNVMCRASDRALRSFVIKQKIKQTIQERVQSKSLAQYPLWCSMANAYATAARLEHALETEKRLFQQTLEPVLSLDDCLHATMQRLTTHQQTLFDALYALSTLLTQSTLLPNAPTFESLRNTVDETYESLQTLLTDIQRLDNIYLTHYKSPDIKQPAPLPLPTDEALSFIAERWETLSKPLDFSLSKTIELLHGAMRQFQSQAVLGKPAVIVIGGTGRGKSTLTNACSRRPVG